MIGQTAFHYEVRPGDSADKVLDRLAYQVNEAALDGSVSEIAATVQDGVLKITALDGVARQVAVGTRNASDPTDDLFSSVESAEGSSTVVASLSGTMERGDAVSLEDRDPDDYLPDQGRRGWSEPHDPGRCDGRGQERC